jgi:WD40 repeat protein
LFSFFIHFIYFLFFFFYIYFYFFKWEFSFEFAEHPQGPGCRADPLPTWDFYIVPFHFYTILFILGNFSLQSIHKDRVAALIMRSGQLISGSDDGTVGVVDLRHLKADKSHVMRGHLGPVTAVQLNGGNYVASGSTDRTVSSVLLN